MTTGTVTVDRYANPHRRAPTAAAMSSARHDQAAARRTPNGTSMPSGCRCGLADPSDGVVTTSTVTDGARARVRHDVASVR